MSFEDFKKRKQAEAKSQQPNSMSVQNVSAQHPTDATKEEARAKLMRMSIAKRTGINGQNLIEPSIKYSQAPYAAITQERLDDLTSASGTEWHKGIHENDSFFVAPDDMVPAKYRIPTLEKQAKKAEELFGSQLERLDRAEQAALANPTHTNIVDYNYQRKKAEHDQEIYGKALAEQAPLKGFDISPYLDDPEKAQERIDWLNARIAEAEAKGEFADADTINNMTAEEYYADADARYQKRLRSDWEVYRYKQERDALERFLEKSDVVRKANFGGEFAANFDLGYMDVHANNMAADASLPSYLTDIYETSANRYRERNQDALNYENKSKILEMIAEDTASMLPQQIEQMKYSTMASLPALPLRIFAPGVGKVASNLMAAQGTNAFSKKQMEGATIRELKSMGLSDADARKYAKDEAGLSAAVESADVFLDLVRMGDFGEKGISFLVDKLPVPSWAKPILNVGARLALNSGQEAAEEFVQEAIHQANIERAQEALAKDGKLELIKATGEKFGEFARGENEEGFEQAKAAARAGARGALGLALPGGIIKATAQTTQSAIDARNKNNRNRILIQALGQMIEGPESLKLAERIAEDFSNGIVDDAAWADFEAIAREEAERANQNTVEAPQVNQTAEQTQQMPVAEQPVMQTNPEAAVNPIAQEQPLTQQQAPVPVQDMLPTQEQMQEAQQTTEQRTVPQGLVTPEQNRNDVIDAMNETMDNQQPVEQQMPDTDAVMQAHNDTMDRNQQDVGGGMAPDELVGGADINIDVEIENKEYGIQSYNDYIGVQKSVFNGLDKSNFFDKDTKRRVVQNKETGIVVEIDKKGIRETLGIGNRFQTLPSELKRLKVATIKYLPYIIENGTVLERDVRESHTGNPDLKYTYIQHPVTVDGKTVYVVVDIRQSRQKNKFWMHGVYLERKSAKPLSTSAENSGQAVNKGLADGDIVSSEESRVNQNNQTNPAMQAFEDTMNQAEDAPGPSKNMFKSEVKESKGHTIPDFNKAHFVPAKAQIEDMYTAVTEEESLHNAETRLLQDYDGEKARLQEITNWDTNEDVDMAMSILSDMERDARESGNWSEYVAWSKHIQENNRETARALQALAKYQRWNGAKIVELAAQKLNDSTLSPEQINETMSTVSKLADSFDAAVSQSMVGKSVDDLVEVIKLTARSRSTGFYQNKVTNKIPDVLKPLNWAIKRVANKAKGADITTIDRGVIPEAQRFAVGETVHPSDRKKLGTIVGNNGDGTYQVRFENKKNGRTAVRTFDGKELAVERKTEASAPKTAAEAQQQSNNEAYEFLQRMAANGVLAFATDPIGATFGEYVMTLRNNNMLSKPATIFRNIGGNTISTTLNTISNDVAVPFDMLLGLASGTRSVPFTRLSKTGADAFMDGAAMGMLEAVLDVSGSEDIGKYGDRDGRTAKMTGNALEKGLSLYEGAIQLGLVAPDKAFKQAIAAEYNRGLGALYEKGKIKDENGSLADAATQEADYQTFANDSGITRFTQSVRRGANEFLNLGNLAEIISKDGETFGLDQIGLGSVAVPYVKAPTNIGAMVVEYLTAVPRSVAEAVRFSVKKKNGTLTAADQARAAKTFGKAITSSALLYGAMRLSAMGIIKILGNQADDDEEGENEKGFRQSRGESGIQINMSALERHLKGEDTTWQDDDDLENLGWDPILTAHLSIGALMAENYKETGNAKIIQSAYGGAMAAVRELPMMGAISDAADMADGRGNGLKSFAVSSIDNLITPNVLKGISQGLDPYQRDTSADTFGGMLGNRLRSTWARDTLPIKQNVWGEDMMNEGGWQNFANKTVRPGEKTTFRSDALDDEVARIAEETGRADVYPRAKAPDTVTIGKDKVELTKEQKTEYQTSVGQTDRKLRQAIMDSPSYFLFDTELEEAAFVKAKDYAAEVTKMQMFDEYKPAEWIVNLQGADEQIIANTLIAKATESEAKAIGDGKAYAGYEIMIDNGQINDVTAELLMPSKLQTAYNEGGKGIVSPVEVLDAYSYINADGSDTPTNEKLDSLNGYLQTTYANEPEKMTAMYKVIYDVYPYIITTDRKVPASALAYGGKDGEMLFAHQLTSTQKVGWFSYKAKGGDMVTFSEFLEYANDAKSDFYSTRKQKIVAWLNANILNKAQRDALYYTIYKK